MMRRPPEADDPAGASVLWCNRLVERLAPVVSMRPTASNPSGLMAAAGWVEDQLRGLGFSVVRLARGDSPPILVATRDGLGSVRVGITGHYDIEESGTGWATNPFEPTIAGGRLYGRGTADNLGPLALRLSVLADLGTESPPLLMVLHGEEEVGSRTAHAVYPDLPLPEVGIWLEETGYFELDGTQRLLVRRAGDRATQWIGSVVAIAEAHGRRVELHDRYLNKAFGTERCPFLTHLAGAAPYLAIGPNDPGSKIHRPNESLPLSNLDVSAEQFAALLRAVSQTRE